MYYQNDHMIKMIKEGEIRERIHQAETDRLIAACRPNRSIQLGRLARQALHAFGHLLLQVGKRLDQVGTQSASLARQ
jgi:hypothetical protein